MRSQIWRPPLQNKPPSKAPYGAASPIRQSKRSKARPRKNFSALQPCGQLHDKSPLREGPISESRSWLSPGRLLLTGVPLLLTGLLRSTLTGQVTGQAQGYCLLQILPCLLLADQEGETCRALS